MATRTKAARQAMTAYNLVDENHRVSSFGSEDVTENIILMNKLVFFTLMSEMVVELTRLRFKHEIFRIHVQGSYFALGNNFFYCGYQ